MSAVEVFATYAPKHRRDLAPVLISLRDMLVTETSEPRHRAEVSR